MKIDYRRSSEECAKAYLTFKAYNKGEHLSVVSFVAGWNSAKGITKETSTQEEIKEIKGVQDER